jgi:hypothetical protein
MWTSLFAFNSPDPRQRKYAITTMVILFTLPVYCIAFLLLTFAPPNKNPNQLTAPVVTLNQPTLTVQFTATVTPTLARTSTASIVTLPATPTQFVPASSTPSPTRTPQTTGTTAVPTETCIVHCHTNTNHYEHQYRYEY